MITPFTVTDDMVEFSHHLNDIEFAIGEERIMIRATDIDNTVLFNITTDQFRELVGHLNKLVEKIDE